MAVMTIQTIVDSGLAASYTAANTGDTAADDGTGRMFIEVVNGAGAPITVTVPAQTTTVVVPGAGSMAISDITVSVTNGTTKKIGPFTRAYINTAGNVTVNYSSATTITSGAFKLAKED